VRAVQCAVGAEHDLRIRDEPTHVVLAHRGAEHVHVLLVRPVRASGRLDDAHVRLDRRDLPVRRDLGECLAGQRFLGRIVHDADVLRTAVLGQRLLYLLRIEEVAIGHDHANRGVPERVGIDVGLEIDAFPSRALEELRHALRGLVPDRGRAHLDVRNLDRQLCLAADAQHFVERVEGATRFVADVTDIEALGCGSDPGQLDDFLGGGEMRRFVLETGRQAERPRRQFPREQDFHLREFLRRRGTVEIRAHHLLAQRCVPDHGREVDRRRVRGELRKIVPQREVRLAVLPDQDRRDALARDRRGVQVFSQAATAVAVHVDEAGRKCEPALVEHRLVLLRCQV